MYTPSISLSIYLKLLLLGAVSAFILSGCTAGRQIVQPYYRERPNIPETLQNPSPQPTEPVGHVPSPQISPYTSTSRIEQQDPSSPAEQLAYNRQVLQPIRATVRGRVSFYAERVKSWQEAERTTSEYRTPEQSVKLLSCRSRVSSLYDAYTDLQIQLFNYRPPADSREKFVELLQNLQNRDFAYLEGECPILFKQLSDQPEQKETVEIPSPPITFSDSAQLQPARTDFSNYPQNETPSGQALNGISTDLRPDAEPPQNYEERYQQALSLLKQRKEQESRRMLSDLLADVRQTGNRALQIKILQKISEVEFALRNYIPARILHEELRQLNAPFDQQRLAALQSVDTQREETDSYAALLLSSLTFTPEQDGFTVVQQAQAFIQTYPGSPLRADAENLAGRAEQEAEQWFQELLRQSDQLAADDRRPEALALLEKVPLDILPLDKQEVIQQKKNSLAVPAPVPAYVPVPAPVPVQAEFPVPAPVPIPAQTEFPPPSTLVIEPARPEAPENAPQENRGQGRTSVAGPMEIGRPDMQQEETEGTRSSTENKEKTSSAPGRRADTALQEKWDKAEAAFQAAEYDKAIVLFTELQNTPLDAKARKKIEKASLEAGQEARRKAANFFQRANSATDPEVRKQHLLSSKTLLEDILQKYPLAGLDDKVKRNLSRVDKELAALDHTPFN